MDPLVAARDHVWSAPVLPSKELVLQCRAYQPYQSLLDVVK
jgi:hypothetical protein